MKEELFVACSERFIYLECLVCGQASAEMT
jgi:hypothetical protein